ncbi:MAG: MBL fold metallo-hydrolase [Phyllobacteriaceae bacterium]|nr:MBL fold metallo-hydrolase [Phyllobacteriaceae bacterium]
MSHTRFNGVSGAFWPTRRQVLAGFGAVAATAILPVRRAFALDIGGMEVSTVSDGNLMQPVSFMLPDTPEAEAKALFEANGLTWGPLAPDCNVTVLKTADRLVVFDVGAGSNFMATAGKLLENFSAAGLDPAAVTDVVFTHGHPDHLWGAVDDLDELVFPEAAWHMGQAEWDYWAAPDTLAATPDDRKAFVVGAQSRMKAIGEKISFFKPGAEVLPGVEAIDTSGHTPGHMSFMLHGKNEPVIVIGDALTNAVISLKKPEWPIGPDQDREQGVKTRLALLDRLATDKARVIGYHLPSPGIGRIERKDGAYAFAAEG